MCYYALLQGGWLNVFKYSFRELFKKKYRNFHSIFYTTSKSIDISIFFSLPFPYCFKNYSQFQDTLLLKWTWPVGDHSEAFSVHVIHLITMGLFIIQTVCHVQSIILFHNKCYNEIKLPNYYLTATYLLPNSYITDCESKKNLRHTRTGSKRLYYYHIILEVSWPQRRLLIGGDFLFILYYLDYRTAECILDWIHLLAFTAFHLSLDKDCNTAELLW